MNEERKSVSLLKEYLILNEAAVVSWRNAEKSISDVILEFAISEWNFTKKFSIDFHVPQNQADAHARIEDLFPTGKLVVVCRNVAHFVVDRVMRHNRPDLLMVRTPVPDAPEAYLGPLTVYGASFQRESDLLKTLGEFQNSFFHWILDATDARFHIVAEDMDLPNFPRTA